VPLPLFGLLLAGTLPQPRTARIVQLNSSAARNEAFV
jgi:hypothetical protein